MGIPILVKKPRNNEVVTQSYNKAMTTNKCNQCPTQLPNLRPHVFPLHGMNAYIVPQ